MKINSELWAGLRRDTRAVLVWDPLVPHFDAEMIYAFEVANRGVSSYRKSELRPILSKLKGVDRDDAIDEYAAWTDRHRDRLLGYREYLRKHRVRLSSVREPPLGDDRKPYCWLCKRRIGTDLALECGTCGWRICECGACGCGKDEGDEGIFDATESIELADYEFDGWELEDGKIYRSAVMNTAKVPNELVGNSLKIGDIVELMFRVASFDWLNRREGPARSERMWVKLTEVASSLYVGHLDSSKCRELPLGMRVVFTPDHVIEVWEVRHEIAHRANVRWPAFDEDL